MLSVFDGFMLEDTETIARTSVFMWRMTIKDISGGTWHRHTTSRYAVLISHFIHLAAYFVQCPFSNKRNLEDKS